MLWMGHQSENVVVGVQHARDVGERTVGIHARRVPRRPERGARVKATVLVRPKPGILDPQGQAVESSLRHLGFDVGEARIGRLVDVELATEDADEARAQLEQMCERLLANPLIESFEIELEHA